MALHHSSSSLVRLVDTPASRSFGLSILRLVVTSACRYFAFCRYSGSCLLRFVTTLAHRYFSATSAVLMHFRYSALSRASTLLLFRASALPCSALFPLLHAFPCFYFCASAVLFFSSSLSRNSPVPFFHFLCGTLPLFRFHFSCGTLSLFRPFAELFKFRSFASRPACGPVVSIPAFWLVVHGIWLSAVPVCGETS